MTFRTVLALITVSLCMAGIVSAAEVEVRDFGITVDGKAAGDYRMTIRRHDENTVSVTGRSETKVTILGFTAYSFTYDGKEVWQNDRLQRFTSSGAENGKRYTVALVPEGDRLRVTANGQSTLVRPDVWVNTYWRLPAAGFRGRETPLLGCDTGKEHTALLQFVGAEKLSVAGQIQECTHHRIMTTPPHDLWFDSQERLVRQEWVTDGHRTVLDLIRVQH